MLFMRTVGMAFNVYLSNRVGAAGMGLYTLAMSVYSFGVTFATSGVNLAATRLTAEAMAEGERGEGRVRRKMLFCIIYSAAFGIASSAVLFFAADFIGTRLLADSRTVKPIMIMAVSMPFISVSSALNGYFQAVRRVYKNAISQISEQFVKIACVSFLLSLMLPRGIEGSCIAIVCGTTISEIFSFVTAFIMYRRDLMRHIHKNGSEGQKNGSKMLSIALPVAISSYVRSTLLTIEHILIPRGLRKNGINSETALASYGVIHGMVFPVLLFPQAVLSAAAGLIVPEMAQSAACGENRRIAYMAERVFQITLAFSIGVSGIMMAFSSELGLCIYSNAEASLYIRLFAPLIPLMYLDHVTDGMLKGVNQQLYSMRVNIADSLISVIAVWLLVPRYGIFGYVITIFACEMLNCGLSICRLLTVTGMRISLIRRFFLPLACIAGATSVETVLIEKTGILQTLPPSAALVLEIVFAALVYIAMLVVTKSISRDDIVWIKNIVKGA